jgi:hypothetical protein
MGTETVAKQGLGGPWDTSITGRWWCFPRLGGSPQPRRDVAKDVLALAVHLLLSRGVVPSRLWSSLLSIIEITQRLIIPFEYRATSHPAMASSAAGASAPERSLDGLASVLAGLPERFSFPDSEQEMLELWASIHAFEKQLEYSRDRPEFTFYDGPPFATGEL